MADSRGLSDHHGIAGMWTARITSEIRKNQADAERRRSQGGAVDGSLFLPSSSRRSMNYRDTVELESPAPPSHAPPPTPPASELRDSSDSESEHVSDRIVKMQEQQARIAMLEEEVRSNDLEIGHLKEQIGNANTEQCQAVLDDDQGKIARLRRQVEGLGRLLKEALGRERKLESELSDMRRHLREARSTMNDIPNDNEARETREERARQQRQIEDVLRAQSALGDDFRSFAQRDAQEPNAVKDAPAKISRRRRRQSRLIIIASRGTKKPWTPV